MIVVQTSIERAKGYYWVRIKRTKLWIIAKWSPSVKTWSTCEPFENDTRGGFDIVDEHRLDYTPPVEQQVRRKHKQEVIRRRR